MKLNTIFKFLKDTPNWGENTEEYKQDRRQKVSLNISLLHRKIKPPLKYLNFTLSLADYFWLLSHKQLKRKWIKTVDNRYF